MRKTMKRIFGSAVVVLSAIALSGCIAAVPLAIYYFSTPSEHVATAEVPHPAADVYAAVLRDAGSAGAGMAIVKRDDASRLVVINDGVQTATIKVIEEPDKNTQIIVTSNIVERDAQKELALQVLRHLCQNYGDDCRVQ